MEVGRITQLTTHDFNLGEIKKIIYGGGKIATINVIEIDNVKKMLNNKEENTFIKLRSFPDNEQGNKNAEDFYKNQIILRDPKITDSERQTCIDNGSWNDSKYLIVLVKST